MSMYSCPKCGRKAFVPSGQEGAPHECGTVGCNNFYPTGKGIKGLFQKMSKIGKIYVVV